MAKKMSTGTTIRLHIEGMSCQACVGRLERTLRSVAGVNDAHVDLTTETATVTLSNGRSGVHAESRSAASDLIQAVRGAGYEAEVFRPAQDLHEQWHKARKERSRVQRQAFVQALAFSAPVFALEWLGPMLSSTNPGAHIWWRALQALLCLLLLRSPAGAPILVSGLRGLIFGHPGMDALIALGVGLSFLAGVASLFVPVLHAFHFHAAAMILVFINLGRWLEVGGRREAGEAVAALAARMPKQARRVDGPAEQEVDAARLKIGDRIRVVQDEVLAVDGEVLEGKAEVDLSAITGESLPAPAERGKALPSGALVVSGELLLRVTRTGEQSTLARILALLESVQTSKLPIQRLADQIAAWFIPALIGLAAIALLIHLWPFWGDEAVNAVSGEATSAASAMGSRLAPALRAVVSVLVIACPCAVGLAAPAALSVATGVAARRGILVRDPAVFESMSNLRELCFDKTGTLTTAEPKVDEVVDDSAEPTLSGAREVLRMAASVEQRSGHPIARAIVRRAREWEINLERPTEFSSETGLGVVGKVDGKTVIVGREQFLLERGIAVENVRSAVEQVAASGRILVLVAVNGACAGWIALSDQVRPEAYAAIHALQRMGVRCRMLTGDHAASATHVAGELGIGLVHAQLSPPDKVEVVRSLQASGAKIGFVGDGVNDGPVLAAADVGFAMADATDVALVSAPVTLAGASMVKMEEALSLSRAVVRIMKENFFWAVIYNLIAIPAAMSGHISAGWAAAMMMASSLSVVLNALRLKRWRRER